VVHLLEEKVYATLGKEAEQESCQWVLDTDASNHMSGCRGVFSSIDDRTVGTVKFANGLVVKIEGLGTGIFECKNGEDHSLANVYFIPRLTASIISVGQLDEYGYEIQIKNGLMLLRDEDQRLLARVPRNTGRLYKLELKIARPVCLAVCTSEDAWRWHANFGHVNFTSLRKMAAGGLVCGLPELDQVEQMCEACVVGKHK
jgi:hypothetical protein